ncbi:sigma-54 dependent transcriptional regulator [Myxococcota bacterium]|nr:sigma-54 dependent transcriptional regulator [Myxococcota bacterium]
MIAVTLVVGIEVVRDARGLGRKQPPTRLAIEQIVGRGRELSLLMSQLPRIAASEVSVLVTGETGTGKELYARALHELSGRARGAFVPVNCGALPIDIADNELFGHTAGAYTHAAETQSGLVESAGGGTLFLDEVDALPLAIQVKLLRFLQDRSYRRLGCPTLRIADVRVVAAMNAEPRSAVAEGRLRSDLYYRLATVSVEMPPLRERRDDIVELAEHFLREHGGDDRRLSPFAVAALLRYDWPGNVRELEGVIRRAVILAEGCEVSPEHLVLPVSTSVKYPSFQDAKADVVEAFERRYLEQTLKLCGGNISRAAELAGKNRRAFFELLRKHGIEANDFRREPRDTRVR